MDRQFGLSDEQERMGLEGLGILARIIARHVVSSSGLYRDGSDGREAEPTSLHDQGNVGRPPEQTDDAA